MKKTLAHAAKQGRFGDDSLIHVSKHEIKGLASLVPGGKLPTNPKTGLHEAFFFLPFLAAAAAAAPAAAAAAPVVAGLGAATAGAAGAAGLAGLGAAGATAASALPAAAAALPAAAGSSLLGSAAGSGIASGLAASSPALTSGAALGTSVASAAPTAAGLGAAAPTAAAAAPTAAAGTGLGGLVPPTSFLGGVPTGAMPSVTGLNAAAAAPSSGAATTGAGTAALPSQAVQNASLQAAMTARPDVAAAAGGAKGGLGGLFGNMDLGKMLQYGSLAAMMMPKGGGGGDDDGKSKNVNAKSYSRGDEAQPDDKGNSGGVSGEFNYFPRAHYFAKGGLASLDGGGGGGDDTSDQDLITATEQAIQTQSPDSQQIIQQFVAKFGPEALQHLVMQIQQQGGGQQAQGDGMSDSVPASITGQSGTAPAQLSEGEYIMPADVVAHLGNGSTQAGAKQLDGMQARIRAMRGAPSEGPNQIDPQAAMPA